MKKLISLITIIALLVATLTVFSSCGGNKGAASVEATKLTENENITWSYSSETKTLKIIATSAEPAELPTFEKGKAPWFSIRTSAVKLELSNIAKISDYAFYSMYYIKEIAFDSAVTEIGKCAFAFCASLEALTLPENVKSIGESAFEGCGNLKSVKLPASVESLGERAFAYNHALTAVTVDNALSQDNFNSVFEGITMPTITTAGNVEDSTNESAPESDAPEAEESTESATDSTDDTEKKDNETEAPAVEKPNDTTTIIAIIVLALVIVGLVVGGILLARSNKKQTKDSRTVRKNGNDKYNKNAKGKKK